MITLAEVTKAFGGRVLFANSSLQVNRGDRLGLVGPNGAGKSTLFRLILRVEEPDAGKIIIDRRASIGYLPQESAPAGDETVLELAVSITPEMARLRQQLRAWENDHEVDTAAYHEAHARYELLGGYTLEPRAKQILAGLSFRETDFDRPARELSGGWVMRARLAQLLVQTPDLLMLDEPTNHLDLQSLLWFQDYLKTYPGAIVVISHDREFLNQLVETIVEIRQGRLLEYRGNYDSFLTQREAQVSQLEAAYKNQQREIAHLMEFVDRFRAKNTKATQAQSKLKQIERMEKIEAPVNDEPDFHFAFPQPERTGQRVIELSGVAHAYGDNWVYRELNFEAERGQRIVLVGPNGAGKSTLLKLLAAVLPVQQGERKLGYHVKAGYYSQNRAETLRLERTVLAEALDTPQRMTEQSIRTVLGTFGFRGDDVFKTIQVLSGGEKSRLALVKLLLDPPNLLLMDEPTTHLDIVGVEALVHALEQFSGTVIFISHDVYFIRRLANQVVRVFQGQLVWFKGDYQYYLDKSSFNSEREAIEAGGQPDTAPEGERTADRLREQRRQLVAQQNERARRRRLQKSLVDKLEKEIHELEQRQGEITAQLQDPATYQKGQLIGSLNRELAELHDRLPALNTEWETAATLLAEIESESLE